MPKAKAFTCAYDSDSNEMVIKFSKEAHEKFFPGKENSTYKTKSFMVLIDLEENSEDEGGEKMIIAESWGGQEEEARLLATAVITRSAIFNWLMSEFMKELDDEEHECRWCSGTGYSVPIVLDSLIRSGVVHVGPAVS